MTNINETAQAETQAPAPETTAPVDAVESTEAQADNAPEAQEEESAPSEQDSGEIPAEEPKPKKKGGGFQNRIDQLTREKYEAELRARQAESLLEQARKQTQRDDSVDPGEQPSLDAFSTIEEWQKAVADWGIQKGRHEAYKQNEAKEQEYKQLQQQAAQMQRDDALRAKVDAARRTMPDFDAVVSPIAHIVDSNPVLLEYAYESEAAPQVAYHLAKNPSLLMQITKMTPVAALRELTKLEARLSAPPPPKQVTNAPAPIKPVGARDTVVKSIADIANGIDASAYIAKMNKLG